MGHSATVLYKSSAVFSGTAFLAAVVMKETDRFRDGQTDGRIGNGDMLTSMLTDLAGC